MTDVRVSRGQTISLDAVDGDLKVGNNATIQASNSKTILVTGGVYLEGKAYINGDLECESLESKVFFSKVKEANFRSHRARLDLTSRHVGKLETNGNLTVHKQLNVTHTVRVKGTIMAKDIDVGGRIEADTIKCNRMRVGGRAEIRTMLEASSVDVGGKVVAAGIVKIDDLRVGGEVEVGGGSIKGNIRVGGRFVANEALEFGDLQVSGRGFLPANCTGKRISTFGKLSVGGNINCSQIEAGGSIDIEGDCQAVRVEVGGKLQVSGNLVVSYRLEGFGTVDIGGNFESKQLRISGKFTANKIQVQEEADISGKTETKEGLKTKLLIARLGSRCDGVIIANRVEIGKSADLSWGTWGTNWAQKWAAAGAMAKVDDVYASEVVLGPMCRAKSIFANKVKLEQGSVAQQVIYTSELKIDFGAAVAEQPQKVTNLPKPSF